PKRERREVAAAVSGFQIRLEIRVQLHANLVDRERPCGGTSPASAPALTACGGASQRPVFRARLEHSTRDPNLERTDRGDRIERLTPTESGERFTFAAGLQRIEGCCEDLGQRCVRAGA